MSSFEVTEAGIADIRRALEDGRVTSISPGGASTPPASTDAPNGQEQPA